MFEAETTEGYKIALSGDLVINTLWAWMGAMGVLLTTLLLEPVSRSALAVISRSWSGFKETWAAYGMLWCWLPQWVLKGEVG